MTGDFRITIRGIMSERFCRGLPGLRRDVVGGHTVLTGRAGDAGSVGDALRTLGNLGLEVVEVQAPTTPGDIR